MEYRAAILIFGVILQFVLFEWMNLPDIREPDYNVTGVMGAYMFDFSDAMHNVIRFICHNMPPFDRIDPEKLAIGCLKTRSSTMYGTYASVIPMRFEGGAETIIHHGKRYRIPILIGNGGEILYIINFYIPRYVNLDYEEKLKTLFHELYHINPKFDGDIRRFPGRNYAHGHSRRKYDDNVAKYTHEFLLLSGASEKTEFMQHDFQQLTNIHGKVTGRRISKPRPYLDRT